MQNNLGVMTRGPLSLRSGEAQESDRGERIESRDEKVDYVALRATKKCFGFMDCLLLRFALHCIRLV